MPDPVSWYRPAVAMRTGRRCAAVVAVGLALASGLVAAQLVEDRRAPERFRVRLDTTRGAIVIACTRAWAPRGVDRFYTLVTSGYYDDSALFRVVAGKWAQFGIAGTPAVAQAWRVRTIADDPFIGQSNVKGTVAFAFAVKDGRTTQVFFNLVDNSATHDQEPFVVFGRVVEGLEVMDALYDGYGEDALGGIRAGRQDPLFAQGNAYLRERFPKLDYIRTARVE
jgi:peptidyl-prolyl cis-trans isomerase A (cyclophilin A)